MNCSPWRHPPSSTRSVSRAARTGPHSAVGFSCTPAGDDDREGWKGTRSPKPDGATPLWDLAKTSNTTAESSGPDMQGTSFRNATLEGLLVDLYPNTDQSGSQALAEFSRAPTTTQAAFWAEVGKRAAAAHEAQRVEEEEAVDLNLPLSDFYARLYLTPEGRRRRFARRIWGQRWRKRAYRDRLAERRGHKVDDGFDAEKARLEAIEAVDYVFRLAGAEPNRAGYIHCPLHAERTPSFQCRGTKWCCFGCGAHGSIYELAGILWDLPRSGREFREIHDRLVEVFG